MPVRYRGTHRSRTSVHGALRCAAGALHRDRPARHEHSRDAARLGQQRRAAACSALRSVLTRCTPAVSVRERRAVRCREHLDCARTESLSGWREGAHLQRLHAAACCASLQLLVESHSRAGHACAARGDSERGAQCAEAAAHDQDVVRKRPLARTSACSVGRRSADEVWRRAEASARGKRRSQVRVTYGVGHLWMR